MRTGKDMYRKIWNVIGIMLVLSRGQTTAETLFNKQKKKQKKLIRQLNAVLPRESAVIMCATWVALSILK